ncbi:MAG: Protein of unknown function transrane [Bacteroidetes bacterium]|jgi:hypothetical protein|nr:Protein of unknown function transrane [Bacteroidota bacterium]
MSAFSTYADRWNIGLGGEWSGKRELSVDALRGFDMFWIIGGQKIFRSLDEVFHSPTTGWIDRQLDHAEWPFALALGGFLVLYVVLKVMYDRKIYIRI